LRFQSDCSLNLTDVPAAGGVKSVALQSNVYSCVALKENLEGIFLFGCVSTGRAKKPNRRHDFCRESKEKQQVWNKGLSERKYRMFECVMPRERNLFYMQRKT
jgi:hypothetical protein